MSDPVALERRLLPRKAKGTPDEFWLLATRRADLAREEGDAKRGNQHLALASLFGARGFKAGERDDARLTKYLAIFREAQAKKSFPFELEAVQAHIEKQLCISAGDSEPEILMKKAKNVFTDVALYLIADGTNFDAISREGSWLSDEMCATIEAGRGLSIYTGSDGRQRIEVRVMSQGDVTLNLSEYKKLTSSTEPVLLDVPSGCLRLGQPDAERGDCLEVEVTPGVYRVALYNLGYGQKCVVIAVRTELREARNPSNNMAGILSL